MKRSFILGIVAMAIVMVGHTRTSTPLESEGDGIGFHKGDLHQALTAAASDNKLVFVDVYTSWCGPCKRMSSDVFPQKRVGDYFNPRFVSIKIDAERGEGAEIARRYKVTAYPTFLILSPEGELLGKMVGGSPPDDFIRKIDGIYTKLKK